MVCLSGRKQTSQGRTDRSLSSALGLRCWRGSFSPPLTNTCLYQMYSTVSEHNTQQVNSHSSERFQPSYFPRTILLQLDLSKAFDMVSHDKLLKNLCQASLPPDLKRWFNCYGFQSKVNFRNVTSTSRMSERVPQCVVTSPIVFNFYLLKLPPPPTGVFLVQYADDISV